MRLKTRVEQLEKKMEQYEDDKLCLLDFLNSLKGYDYRCVDPLPKFRTVAHGLCYMIEEITDKQKLLDEEQQLIVKANDKIRTQASPNYDGLIKSLEERVEKQEETIKALIDLCKPLLEERWAKSLGKFNDILESALKDLFSSEPTKKCKKSAKSSAEKCKKCECKIKQEKRGRGRPKKENK